MPLTKIRSENITTTSNLSIDSNTLFVDYSNDRIGVGTSTPARKLDVYGSAQFLDASGIQTTIWAEATTGSGGIGTNNNYPFAFLINGSERMRIIGNGNVGIGTTSPQSLLDVRGIGSFVGTSAGSAVQVTNFQNLSTTTGSAVELVFNNSTAFNANQLTKIGFARVNSPYAGDNDMYINLQHNGVTQQRFVLKSIGNMGLSVNPGAWGTAYKAIQLAGQGASIFGSTVSPVVGIGSNGFYDGTNWVYNNSDTAGQYIISGNVHKWYVAPSNGSGNTINLSEVMTLAANGNLGIGTTAPTNKLHVQGSSSDTINSNNINTKIQGGGGNGLGIGTISSSPYTTYIQSGYVVDFATAVYPLSLNPLGGNVGIGTSSPSAKLEVSGTINATDFNSTSDIKLKDNINTINNGLEIVTNINPVSFNWKDNGKKSYGVVAQDIEKLLPEVVSGDDTKHVSYIQLIAFLIASVKELNDKIEELKNKA